MTAENSKARSLSPHQIVGMSALMSMLAIESNVLADDYPWAPIAAMGCLCLIMCISLVNLYAEQRARRRRK